MKTNLDPLNARLVANGKPADAEMLTMLADLRAFNASFEPKPAAPAVAVVLGGDVEEVF